MDRNAVIDCRSEEGITIGLIDGLMSTARVLRRRLENGDMTPNVVEALRDFQQDEDIRYVLSCVVATKYKVVGIDQTCGACPSQWEGEDDQGRYVYARFRHGWLSVKVGDEQVIGLSVRSGEMGDGVMNYDELRELTGHAIEWP